MSDERIWRLYATKSDNTGLELAGRARFSRVCPGYTLIYTQDETLNGAAEVSGEKISLLTASDRKWLTDCGAALLADRLAEERKTGRDDLTGMLDALEQELERARRQVNEGHGT